MEGMADVWNVDNNEDAVGEYLPDNNDDGDELESVSSMMLQMD